MSTTGKTPVSILQETLLRQGIVPFYDLVQSGVGMHQGVFTYQVTAGQISAVGSGRSKKEAKHEAAKIALEQMKVVTPEPLDEEILKLNVTSPYEASLKDNAVGTLGDICVTHELPVPEYNLIREDGPPHAKQFVFSCRVSTMEEMAQGRTKKQAKQLAALGMLNHFSDLKLIDESLLHADGKSIDENYVNVFIESQALKTPIGLKIDDMSRALKDIWTDEQLVMLKALKIPYNNAVKSLTDLCTELSLEFFWDDGLQECGAAHGISLVLSTKPQAVFYGEPPNEREVAAVQALDYLYVMTWDEKEDLEEMLKKSLTQFNK